MPDELGVVLFPVELETLESRSEGGVDSQSRSCKDGVVDGGDPESPGRGGGGKRDDEAGVRREIFEVDWR